MITIMIIIINNNNVNNENNNSNENSFYLWSYKINRRFDFPFQTAFMYDFLLDFIESIYNFYRKS